METRPISDTLWEAFRRYHFATFSQGVSYLIRGMVSVLLWHDRNMADRGVWKRVPKVPKTNVRNRFGMVPKRHHGEVPLSPRNGRGLVATFLTIETIACNRQRNSCLCCFERSLIIECRLSTGIRFRIKRGLTPLDFGNAFHCLIL